MAATRTGHPGEGSWVRGGPVSLYVVLPGDPVGAVVAVLGAVARAGGGAGPTRPVRRRGRTVVGRCRLP